MLSPNDTPTEYLEQTFQDIDWSHRELISKEFIINTNLTKADLTRVRNYHINATLNKIEKARFSLPEAIGLDIVLVDQDLDTDTAL